MTETQQCVKIAEKEVVYMAAKTREILELYFQSKSPEFVKKLRNTIEKDKILYEYEDNLGKELKDMDTNELIGLLKLYKLRSPESYVSQLRTAYIHYDQTVESIRNPFKEIKMPTGEFLKQITYRKNSMNYDIFEDVINYIRNNQPENVADLFELTLQLAYCGICTIEELLSIKEEMIDFEDKTIQLPDRLIRLSDTAFKLLVKNHNVSSGKVYNEEPYDRQPYMLMHWRNSYISWKVSKRTAGIFDDKSFKEVVDIIRHYLTRNVLPQLDIDFSYKTIAYLGFYNHLIAKYGKDMANNIILAKRFEDKDLAPLLKIEANRYQLYYAHITTLRRDLTYFID